MHFLVAFWAWFSPIGGRIPGLDKVIPFGQKNHVLKVELFDVPISGHGSSRAVFGLAYLAVGLCFVGIAGCDRYSMRKVLQFYVCKILHTKTGCVSGN